MKKQNYRKGQPKNKGQLNNRSDTGVFAGSKRNRLNLSAIQPIGHYLATYSVYSDTAMIAKSAIFSKKSINNDHRAGLSYQILTTYQKLRYCGFTILVISY